MHSSSSSSSSPSSWSRLLGPAEKQTDTATDDGHSIFEENREIRKVLGMDSLEETEVEETLGVERKLFFMDLDE